MKYRLALFAAFLVCFVPASFHAQTPRYARVISQNANLREVPAVTSNSTQEIAEDTLIKVLDEKLPWYVVRVGNRVGWMHGDTLEFISTQAPVSTGPTEQPAAPAYSPSKPSSSSRENQQQTTRDSGGSGGSSTRSPGVYRGEIRGPRGGCYYISASGRKVYVDRSMCN